LPRYTVSESPVVATAPAPKSNPVNTRHDEHDADDEHAPTREGIAEIYVSTGRRDGARPSDIQVILEQHGLVGEQVDYIRVRHRNAFVGVRPEFLEKAVTALNGATIAGKQAFAEPARQRV